MTGTMGSHHIGWPRPRPFSSLALVQVLTSFVSFYSSLQLSLSCRREAPSSLSLHTKKDRIFKTQLQTAFPSWPPVIRLCWGSCVFCVSPSWCDDIFQSATVILHACSVTLSVSCPVSCSRSRKMPHLSPRALPRHHELQKYCARKEPKSKRRLSTPQEKLLMCISKSRGGTTSAAGQLRSRMSRWFSRVSMSRVVM